MTLEEMRGKLEGINIAGLPSRLTDALYDWTNENLENRCSICILTEGDMITWLNRGHRNKLVKALINALSECDDLREECREALRYIDDLGKETNTRYD